MEHTGFKLDRLHHPQTAISCYSRKTCVLGRDLLRTAGVYEDRGNNFLNCKSSNVSRRHATITYADDGVWKLMDTRSSNGTFLNNKRLAEGQQRELRDGDIIGLGISGTGPYPEGVDPKSPECYLFKYIEIDDANRLVDLTVNDDAETVIGPTSSRSRNNPPNVQRPLPQLFASTSAKVSASQRLTQETPTNKRLKKRVCVNDEVSSDDDSSDGLPDENKKSGLVSLMVSKMLGKVSGPPVRKKKPKLTPKSRTGEVGMEEKRPISPKKKSVSKSKENSTVLPTCSATSKTPSGKICNVQVNNLFQIKEERLNLAPVIYEPNKTVEIPQAKDFSHSDDDRRPSTSKHHAKDNDSDAFVIFIASSDEDDEDTNIKSAKNVNESDKEPVEEHNEDSDPQLDVNGHENECVVDNSSVELVGANEENSDDDSDCVVLSAVNSVDEVAGPSSRITRSNDSPGPRASSRKSPPINPTIAKADDSVPHVKITIKKKAGHSDEYTSSYSKITNTKSTINQSDAGNQPKASKNVNIRKDSHRRHSKSQVGPFLYEDTIYKDICKWPVLWLEQQRKYVAPPDLGKNDFYRPALKVEPVMSHYQNYEAYQRVFYPLLLHEIWTTIFNDMLNYEAISGYEASVAVDDCEVLENCPLIPLKDPCQPSHDGWANMRCHTFANDRKDILTHLGLCLFDYSLRMADGSYEERTTFAFIQDDSESFAEIDNKEYKLKYSFNVIFHIKSGEHDVSHNKMCKMRRLSSIAAKIRNYNSFLTLPKASLSDIILNPTRVDNIWKHNPRASYPKLMPHCKSLAPRQQSIVEYVTRRIMENKGEPDVLLIQGQPGTGKTKTVAAIAMQLVTSREFKSEDPSILVCAPSNRALDEIVLHLHEILKGIKEVHRPVMVRISGRDGVSEISRQYTPECLAKNQIFKHAPLDPRIKKPADQDAILRVTNDVIKSARIVCCTLKLSSSSSSKLRKHFQVIDSEQGSLPKFSCCIIDEAVQATEIESLAPLVFNFNKLIMVGDPHLLDAKVVSPTAKNNKYGQSLFRRLHDYYSQKPSSVLTVEAQYRMREQIFKWPNAYFYGGSLPPKIVRKSPIHCPIPPYIFLNYTYEESGNNGDLNNQNEVRLITELLESIWSELNFLKNQYSIGVILPNPKFKTELRDQIKQKGAHLKNVEVDVLDNFQGREKDIIVLACIPSNSIKFIHGNKLNMALTRAKYSQWIIGSDKLLKKDSSWKSLIEDAESRKVSYKVLADKIKDQAYLQSRLRSIFESGNSGIP